MQNTMARGGGKKMVPGKKMKNETVRNKASTGAVFSCGETNDSSERGRGGGMIEMHNVYP